MEVFLAQRLPPEVRRELILDTAMELIGEKGYRGLTMKTVAAHCGLTAPAVTYYFKDMQTLLLAVLLRTVMSIEAMDPSHPAHTACLERNEAVVGFLVSRLGEGYDDTDRLARRLVAGLEGVQSAWLRHPEYIDLQSSLLDVVTWIMGQHEVNPEGASVPVAAQPAALKRLA